MAKKLLAILLALAMVFTTVSVPTNVLAETAADGSVTVDGTVDANGEIVERKIERLLVENYKMEYAVKDEFTTEGMVVKAYYSDNTEEELSLDMLTFDGFDSSKEGACEVIVGYEGVTTSFWVKIVGSYEGADSGVTEPETETEVTTDTTERKLVSFYVDEGTFQTEYVVGEAFVYDGMVAMAYYSDNTEERISPEQLKFVGFDSSKEGECVVTAFYGNVTATFYVNIIAGSGTTNPDPVEPGENETEPVETERVLTSFFIDEETVQKEYNVGDAFVQDGIVAMAYYSDNTAERISPEQLKFSGFDSSKEGECVITAFYGNATTTFCVYIVAGSDTTNPDVPAETVEPDPVEPGENETEPVETERVIEDIYVNYSEANINYFVGDEFVTDGMEVYACYSDGEYELVSMEEVRITGYDMSKAGEYEVLVTYREYEYFFSIYVYDTEGGGDSGEVETETVKPDPVDPGENETEPVDPGENETEPVDPGENETEPVDPGENETEPVDPGEIPEDAGILEIEDKQVSIKKDKVEVKFTLSNAAYIKSLAIKDITFDETMFSIESGVWTLPGNPEMNVSYGLLNGVYSASAAYSSPTDCNGAIFTLTLNILDDVELSTSDISCEFIANTTEGAVEVYVVEGAVELVPCVRGDVDADDDVDSDDAIYLLNHILFANLFPLLGEEGGDTDIDYDGDNVITTTDAVYLLNHTLMPDDFVIE